MTAWVARYVGLPFREDGLTRDGLHCWGLCRLVLSEQCGLELPAHGELSAADLVAAARAMRAEAASDPWIKVIAPEPAEPFEGANAAGSKRIARPSANGAIFDYPRTFDVVMMTAMTDGPRPRVLAGHCGVMIDGNTVLHIWKAIDAMQMKIDHVRIRDRILGFYRHSALAACGIRAEENRALAAAPEPAELLARPSANGAKDSIA